LLNLYESKEERRKIIVQVKQGGVKRGEVTNRNRRDVIYHLSAEAHLLLLHPIWIGCIDHCPGRFGVEDF
jgi:hypothetical protein